MRTEQEMYELILDYAKKNDLVLAVYLNGSRANPNVKKDIYQDFDIVYVVKTVIPFINDKSWIKEFGDVLILQEPDKYDHDDQKYAYLIQFMDANRIDLTFETIDYMKLEICNDSLTIPLLDKGEFLPVLPISSDVNYLVRKPSQVDFNICTNEFYWVSLYIVKGLLRSEILYAIDVFNKYVRPQLLLMLSWYVGINTDFKVSVGKSYKYLNKYLPSTIYQKLLLTYPEANEVSILNSLIKMIDLFRDSSHYVQEKLAYDINLNEEKNVIDYINMITKL